MHSFVCKFISIISLSLLVTTSSFGQYYEAGGGLGLLAYWGDLNAPDFETNIQNSKISGTVFLKYNFNGYLGVKSSILFGNIAGDDKRSHVDWQLERNLSFKSTFSEFSLIGEVNPFGYDAKEGSHMFSPFFFAGFSVFHFNPKTLYNGQYYKLQPLGTEGQGIDGFGNKYSLVSTALVFGGGLKLKISESLNLAIELITRRTNTDYIDDVSSNYVDYNTLESGNGAMSAILANRANENDIDIGQLIGQRGGTKVKDYVISGQVTISYNFTGRNSLRLFKRRRNVSCPTL